MSEKEKLYRWNDFLWYIVNEPQYNSFSGGILGYKHQSYIVCSACKKETIINSFLQSEDVNLLYCSNCGFEKKKRNSIGELSYQFLKYLDSEKFSDPNIYEIIDIDGALTPVFKEPKIIDENNDYRVQTKISTNQKGDVQLMILAGSKAEKTKAQLFVVPTQQAMRFDQNDDHPSEVFAVVEATFKNSKTTISS